MTDNHMNPPIVQSPVGLSLLPTETSNKFLNKPKSYSRLSRGLVPHAEKREVRPFVGGKTQNVFASSAGGSVNNFEQSRRLGLLAQSRVNLGLKQPTPLVDAVLKCKKSTLLAEKIEDLERHYSFSNRSSSPRSHEVSSPPLFDPTNLVGTKWEYVFPSIPEPSGRYGYKKPTQVVVRSKKKKETFADWFRKNRSFISISRAQAVQAWSKGGSDGIWEVDAGHDSAALSYLKSLDAKRPAGAKAKKIFAKVDQTSPQFRTLLGTLKGTPLGNTLKVVSRVEAIANREALNSIQPQGSGSSKSTLEMTDDLMAVATLPAMLPMHIMVEVIELLEPGLGVLFTPGVYSSVVALFTASSPSLAYLHFSALVNTTFWRGMLAACPLVSDYINIGQWLYQGDEVIAHGDGDVIGMIKRARNSPLVVRTLMSFSGVVGALLFRVPESSKWFFEGCKAHLASSTGEFDVYFGVIELAKYWYERVSLFAKTGLFADLFEAEPDVRAHEAHEKSIEILQHLTKSGARALDELATAKRVLYKYAAVVGPLSRESRLRLQTLVEDRKRNLKITRTPPVGFIVHGPPGVGKTKLVELVEAMLRKRCGFEDDVTITHYYDPAIKHQDKPSLTMLFCINDAFQTKDEYATTPTLDVLQRIVDSAPFSVEAASIEAKSDARVEAEGVIVTTNSPSYQMSTATGGANKLDRRYWLIKIDLVADVKTASASIGFPEWAKTRLWCDGWFTIKMGRMKNDDSDTINFNLNAASGIEDFTSYPELAVRMVQMIEDRDKGQYVVKTTCKCGGVGDYHFPDCVERNYVAPVEATKREMFAASLVGLTQRIQDAELPTFKKAESLEPLLPPQEEEEDTPASDVEEGEIEVMGAGPSVLERAVDDHATRVFAPEGPVDRFFTRKLDELGMEGGPIDQYVDRKKTSVKDALHASIDSYVGPLKKGVVIGSALGMAALTLGVVAKLILSAREYFEPQGNFVSQNTMPQESSVNIVPQRSGYVPWMSPRTSRSSFTVFNDSFGGRRMHGLVVCPTVVLVPRHLFIDKMENYGKTKAVYKYDCTLRFEHCGNVATVKLASCAVYHNGLDDFAYVYTGNIFRGVGEGIATHMADKVGTYSDSIYGKLSGRAASLRKIGGCVLYSLDGIHTVSGDCGLPLQDPYGNVIGIVIGILEQQSLTIFCPVSRPVMLRALEELRKSHNVDEVSPHGITEEATALVTMRSDKADKSDAAWFSPDELAASDHLWVGSAPKVDSFRPTVVKTPFFSDVEHLLSKEYGNPYTKMHACAATEHRSPMTYRFAACKNMSNYDQASLVRALDYVVSTFDKIEGLGITPMDWNRAISGSEDNVYMNPRDVRKAIGIVLPLYGVNKANAYVEGADGVWTPHPKVIELAQTYVDVARGTGPLPAILAVASRKDEVYPLEKAEKGKARYFYIMCHSYNLAVRRYLLPIIAWATANPWDTGFCGGLNAGSPAWSEIGKKLTGKVFGADQKEFDLRHKLLLNYIALAVRKICLKAGYSEEEAHITERLISMGFCLYVKIELEWFYCWGTFTSGRPDTTFMNCMITKLVIAYVAECEGVDPSKIFLMCLGDDNVGSVPDDVKLDSAAFTVRGRELGYEMTADNKDGPVKYTSIEEITFLKRSFRRDGKYWKGCLDKNSIFKALGFCVNTKPDKMDERCMATVQSMIRESYLHGREFCDQFRAIVLARYPQVLLPSYAEMDATYEAGLFVTWLSPCPTETSITSLEGMITPHAVGECFTEGLLRAPDGNPTFIEQTAAHSAEPGGGVGRLLLVYQPADLNYKEKVENIDDDAPVVEVNAISEEVVSYAAGLRGLQEARKEESLSLFWARPRVVKTFNPATNFFPVELYPTWRAIPEVNTVIRNYGLFRGDPTITVSYTGGSQLFGKYCLWFMPNMAKHSNQTSGVYQPLMATGIINNSFKTTITQCPNITFDFSMASTHVLKLKYPLPITFMEEDDIDWLMYGTVLNPLKTAGGITPPTLSVQVFVSYDDVELARIIPQGQEEVPNRVLSAGLTYASHIASMLPFAFATPASKLLALGSSAAAAMGYSRATVPVQEQSVMRFSGNPATMSGEPDLSFVLGADPNVYRSVESVIPLSTPGESDIKSIMERSAMLLLDWQPITPEACVPNVCSAVAGRLSTTPLAFTSAAFRYWSGSIKYCLEVVTSPMIRTRIGIMIIPPGVTPPIAFDGGGGFLTHIVEVTGTTCYEFEVPYLYAAPFQRTSGLVGAGAGSAQETQIQFFYLADPTGPSATVVYPYVNLWVSAGSNFSLGIPDLENLLNYVVLVYDESEIIPQGADGGVGPLSMSVFGEIITNVETLMKRRVAIGPIQGDEIGDDGSISMPVFPFAPTVISPVEWTAGTFIGWTYLSYFSLPFLGNTGSIVHMVNSSAQTQSTYKVTNKYTLTGLVSQYETHMGAMLFDTTNNPFIEVRNPDRNAYFFRAPASGPKNGEVPNDNLYVNHFARAEILDVPYYDWVGAGDDFRVGGFICTPVLIPRS